MKSTLLQVVQSILSDMDSENVNSISDSTEAQQIASVVEDTYFNIIAARDIPEHNKLIPLVSLADNTKPTHFTYPARTKELIRIDYNIGTASSPDYREIVYVSPLVFMDRMDESAKKVTTVDQSVELFVGNDRDPSYYTSFNDNHIIMDAYDASVEATFLSHSQGGPSGVATTSGVAGTPVLSFSDANTGDSLKGGIRLSTAIMFGPSSNMEVTYMGGNEWDRIVSVDSDPAGSETLYSLISGFGTSPNGGFDDTDRSVNQTLRGESKFHSGEWNYRRRSMGQYGRFQSSWLVGLRYVRFDSTLNYSTRGALNNSQSSNLPRFFSSNDRVKNNLFGPQAGVDLWWNVRPGINLGVGVKGAWVQNDSKRQTIMTSNSLSGFATPGTVILEETRRKGTVLGELEATAIYRLSHSWSVKASYHLLAADDVIFGSVDVPSARDFVNNAATIREPGFSRDSLVVQGATIGAEYMW